MDQAPILFSKSLRLVDVEVRLVIRFFRQGGGQILQTVSLSFQRIYLKEWSGRRRLGDWGICKPAIWSYLENGQFEVKLRSVK